MKRPSSIPVLFGAVALSGVAVLPLSAALAAPVAAQETFIPGTGSSASSIARVQLRSSGLSVGIGLGQARTRYAGQQGNAEAESVDLGLLGTLSKAPVACGVAPGSLFPEGSMPTGVAISSGDGPDEQRTASAGAGTPIELGTQYGSASPNSKADAAVEGARIELAGVLSAIGGTASSTAKLTPGSQREASAVSGLGRLSLADGAVVLEGLNWTAEHRTGARSDSAAGFTVGSMRIAGQYYPASGAAELKSALDAANAALAATGLSLVAPEVAKTAAGISVSPLRLIVSSTPELRAALGPALDAVQPLRTRLLDLVAPFQATPDCGFAKAIGFGYLVADLALIALGDNGAVEFSLGGARAGTEFATYANPFGTGTPLLNPAGIFPGVQPPDLGVAPGAGPLAPGALPPASTTLTPTSGQMAPVSVACRSTHDDGGGCAAHRGELAAGLILALVVLLAAADRLRVRMT
ncbi:hypothetical protein [Sporichthya sp.]|uniref:hypothetical protein n=1 Tax=Sporichthya sp. TaxID=65475 RepID=UPI0017C42940|nr:hypothetical protein [Sporichthya sp.]MBA3745405.1 hypothetical protein [Sporichthya sp.]